MKLTTLGALLVSAPGAMAIGCYGSGKTWGDNYYAAIESVADWCDGKDHTDGSGGFASHQKKTGCFNLPYGKNKVIFEVTNHADRGRRLSQDLCNYIMTDPINNCKRGGENIYAEPDVVTYWLYRRES